MFRQRDLSNNKLQSRLRSFSQPTGRGRFQTGRGLTFFDCEWLNALRLTKDYQLWVVEIFFSNIWVAEQFGLRTTALVDHGLGQGWATLLALRAT